MRCYDCDAEVLKPVRLDADLTARECPRCGGVHLDLLAWRAWRDARPPATDSHAHAEGVTLVKASENRRPLVCQRCGEPMLKYRIATDVENFVDLCMACDDVWLDGGEWELLRHLDLGERLTEIMSEPWQSRIRAEVEARSADARLREALGRADHERLVGIADWIASHPRRDEMFVWLRQRLEHDD